jgi:hypothetical protein
LQFASALRNVDGRYLIAAKERAQPGPACKRGAAYRR